MESHTTHAVLSLPANYEERLRMTEMTGMYFLSVTFQIYMDSMRGCQMWEAVDPARLSKKRAGLWKQQEWCLKNCSTLESARATAFSHGRKPEP